MSFFCSDITLFSTESFSPQQQIQGILWKFPSSVSPSIPPCLALTGFHKPTGGKAAGGKSAFPPGAFLSAHPPFSQRNSTLQVGSHTSVLVTASVPPQKANFVPYRVFVHLHPNISGCCRLSMCSNSFGDLLQMFVGKQAGQFGFEVS